MAHVAERLAIAAGHVPPRGPVGRPISFGLVTAVFATAVALTMLYVGIRELTQPGFVYDRGQVTAAEDVRRAAPASGPDQLMSIEDMRRLSEQD